MTCVVFVSYCFLNPSRNKATKALRFAHGRESSMNIKTFVDSFVETKGKVTTTVDEERILLC